MAAIRDDVFLADREGISAMNPAREVKTPAPRAGRRLRRTKRCKKLLDSIDVFHIIG
jgi:hypothetical protein